MGDGSTLSNHKQDLPFVIFVIATTNITLIATFFIAGNSSSKVDN